MTKNINKWEIYKKRELNRVLPILANLGCTIDDEQIHLSGERYLMSGYKLVLTGTYNNKKVIIKVSSNAEGIKEIRHEHEARITISNINFAYRTFLLPEELLFTKKDGYVISVTTFIKQDTIFTDRPIKDQFFLALKAFETQEGIHSTTYSHIKSIAKVFDISNSKNYIDEIKSFSNKVGNIKLKELLNKSYKFLEDNVEVIDRYSGFLTHTDFVPHNLRVIDNDIYLIDHTSIEFGNKYTSWARFINYMALYNSELESMLLNYVRDNRGEEEYLSLSLMRIYKLVFLIKYYTDSLKEASDNLYRLNEERIMFWTYILESILNDKQADKSVIEKYKVTRDTLRSEEEKIRQKNL